MPGRKQADVERGDLTPEEWRRVARKHTRLPRDKRAAAARVLAKGTGLSLPTVYRRLAGIFPHRVGRPQAASKEQRLQIVAALERTDGRMSPERIHQVVLGGPESPSLQTVRKHVRAWRLAQFEKMQPELPFGPDQPTSFARVKTAEQVEDDLHAVLTRVIGRKWWKAS